MSCVNNLFLIGRLYKDCNYTTTSTGLVILSGVLYVEDTTGDKENKQYINYKIFGKEAEKYASVLQKDRLVVLQGRLNIEKWKDKETQEWKEKTYCYVNSVKTLDYRPSDRANYEKTQQNENVADEKINVPIFAEQEFGKLPF